MASDDNHKGHFDASLPLPADDSKSDDKSGEEVNLAADMIRRKVDSIYSSEPDADKEMVDMTLGGSSSHFSPHQAYLIELTNSGKSLAEIQAAWHQYYQGLPDDQKHRVWEEFYSAQAQASQYPIEVSGTTPKRQPPAPKVVKPTTKRPRSKVIERSRSTDYSPSEKRPRQRLSPLEHLKSVAFGLSMGALVVLVFLFGFFNERFIAPFIQPSRNVTNTPIISENTISNPNPEIIIPKINVEIPVVYGVTSIDPEAVQQGLQNGALHYADTPLPGQDGNIVIIGHSAVNIFVAGNYKYAFSLLRKLENGDTFYLLKDKKRYTYQIYIKETVKPTDVGVLGPAPKAASVTLITCDPPGLNVNRMVIVGEQVDPNPIANAKASPTQNIVATKAAIVPGNSPTLWSRIVHWFQK